MLAWYLFPFGPLKVKIPIQILSKLRDRLSSLKSQNTKTPDILQLDQEKARVFQY